MRKRFAVACIVCASLLGCAAKLKELPPQPTATHLNQIGYVHLSMGQPIPLDGPLRQALSPKFALTGEAAYTASIPTTAAALRYALDSVTASLKLAGPGKTDTTSNSSSSATQATSNNTGSTVTAPDSSQAVTGTTTTVVTSTGTTTISATRGRTVGEVATSAPPTVDKLKAAVHTTTPAEASQGALGSDPMLRYLNAMTLFNAVTTLNNVIDRIQPPDGWDAYVVPVRVSLSPLGRNWPYDLRSTLIFSGVTQGPKGPAVVASGGEPSAQIIALASDSHDSMSTSNAEDVARSFGLGLGFVAGLTGVSADFGKLSQLSDLYRGSDMHALFTAGQSGPNSMDVRVGAMRIGEDRFAAMERTHLMVFVVMVPKGATHILATASNSFIHATSGAVVRDVDASAVETDIERTLRRYGIYLPGVCDCAQLVETGRQAVCRQAFEGGANLTDVHAAVKADTLRRIQQLSQYGRLKTLEQCVGLDTAQAPNAGFTLVNLSASLAYVMDSTRFSKALVPVPPKPERLPMLAPPPQTVLLTDDGKSMVTGLQGAAHLDKAKSVHAFLRLKDARVAASSTTLTGGDAVAITFPSIKGFLAPTAKAPVVVQLEVDRQVFDYPALYRGPQAPKKEKATDAAKDKEKDKEKEKEKDKGKSAEAKTK